MRMNPTIVPLDTEGNLYALRDEKGQFIGTGTREVCEVLLYILKNCTPQEGALAVPASLKSERPNLRSAISI